MLIRNFNPDDIYFRCKICGHSKSKHEFPTNQKVCKDCVAKLNWHVPKRRGRRKKSEIEVFNH